MSKPKVWTLPELLDRIWMLSRGKRTAVETTELRTSGPLAGTGGRTAHRVVTAYDEDYKDRTYHLNKIGAPVAAALYERIKTMRAKDRQRSAAQAAFLKQDESLRSNVSIEEFERRIKTPGFWDYATGGDVEEPEIGRHYLFFQHPPQNEYRRFTGHVCKVVEVRAYDDPGVVVVLEWTTRPGGSLWGLEDFARDFTKLARVTNED